MISVRFNTWSPLHAWILGNAPPGVTKTTQVVELINTVEELYFLFGQPGERQHTDLHAMFGRPGERQHTDEVRVDDND